MHVVLIAASNHPLAEPFAGGLEAITSSLVRGLRAKGVDVTLFAGEGSDPALDAILLPVRALTLSDAARGDTSMVPEAWLREHHAYLQAMLSLQGRTDVDVIHNHSLHHLPIVLSQLANAPMLTTLHTPPTPWLEPAIALHTDPRSRFVAVSRFTARSWSHVADAAVIHNGIDTRLWPLGPGGPDLVWFGRLVPEKAPHLACEVAARTGRRLRLAGPIGNHDYFRSRIQPYLGDTITYAGHLDNDAVSSLVGRSAVTLVTPAWDEPFGLVAAESLACGTPVLGLDRGGLSEFVGSCCGYLVPAVADGRTRSDDDLVTDLVAALPGVEWRSRTHCHRHATEVCSVEAMVNAYLGLYDRLIADRAA